MRDRPAGPELLSIALDTLRDEILPFVDPQHKVDVLMVANAMGIAMRELQAGDEPLRLEYHRLADLCGEEAARIEDHLALNREIRRLNRQLARMIRGGLLDRPDPGLRDHLWESTKAKLRETNPKYLKRCGLS